MHSVSSLNEVFTTIRFNVKNTDIFKLIFLYGCLGPCKKIESNLGIILDLGSSRSVITNQRVFLGVFGVICVRKDKYK